MIVMAKKNRTKIVLNDKQLSNLLSLLAVGVAKFGELKDKEVTTTQKDLVELSAYIFNSIGLKMPTDD